MTLGAGVTQGEDTAVVEFLDFKKVIISYCISHGYIPQLRLVFKDWSFGTNGCKILFNYKLTQDGCAKNK